MTAGIRAVSLAITVMLGLACGDGDGPSLGDGGDLPSDDAASAGRDGGPGGDGPAMGGTDGATPGISGSDCKGSWGTPELVLEEPGMRVLSPSVTGNGLELFYVRSQMDNSEMRFVRASRTNASQSFSAGAEVPALNAACANTDQREIDVSEDARRIYFTCHAADATQAALRRATRVAGDAFEVEGESLGTFGLSPALSPDELTLYTTNTVEAGGPLMATRLTRDAPFGAPAIVPGTENASLASPDISGDGLFLFGQTLSQVVVANRASHDDAFMAVQPVLMPISGIQGAPHISADCKTLFFVSAQLAPESVRIMAVRR